MLNCEGHGALHRELRYVQGAMWNRWRYCLTRVVQEQFAKKAQQRSIPHLTNNVVSSRRSDEDITLTILAFVL